MATSHQTIYQRSKLTSLAVSDTIVVNNRTHIITTCLKVLILCDVQIAIVRINASFNSSISNHQPERRSSGSAYCMTFWFRKQEAKNQFIKWSESKSPGKNYLIFAPFTFHLSPFTFHLSPSTFHLPPFTSTLPFIINPCYNVNYG